MAAGALFPILLGDAFGQMGQPLRVVHRGVPNEYIGTATVQRGRSPLARLACAIAGLPPDMSSAPVRVRVDVDGSTERWTRWFGNAPAMVSRLAAREGLLRERLGPSVTDFRLTVKEGVLHWEAVRLWVLGVPLPRYAFDMRARVCAHGERYRFQIDARLHLLGALISYEGELDVREQ